jgi:hypothetical protein
MLNQSYWAGVQTSSNAMLMMFGSHPANLSCDGILVTLHPGPLTRRFAVRTTRAGRYGAGAS